MYYCEVCLQAAGLDYSRWIVVGQLITISHVVFVMSEKNCTIRHFISIT